MKPALALALVLWLVAVIPTAPAPAAQRNPCAVPEALSQSGAERAARSAYVALLRERPSLQCARDGLTELNEPKPSTANKEASALCDQAEAYRDAHRDDDALSAYKAALEKDPTKNSCGAEGLKDMAPWWASRAVDGGLGMAPKILAFIGAVLILGLLVLMLGYTRAGGRILAKLPVSRTILRPRLALADLTDQAVNVTDQGTSPLLIGAGLTARIRERLQRFREEALDEYGLTYSLDVGTSSQDLADIVSNNGQLRDSLSKLGDVSEHTRLVALVVNALIAALPIKRFAVSGIVEPASGPAASCTLALEVGPRLINAVTLTGGAVRQPPVKASDYLGLAASAAVWIQYGVAREVSLASLGPETAESYALVLEGIRLYEAADMTDEKTKIEAINTFEEALALDSSNTAAKLNLAMAHARLRGDFDVSEAILGEAVDDIRSVG